MNKTNSMPNSSELKGKITKMIQNSKKQQYHLITKEPIDSYLTEDVLKGFVNMFEDNNEFIKHLDVLRTFRNYAADMIEKDPSLKAKLFPLFDTTNQLAGILLSNSTVIDLLPKRGFFINQK